MNIEVMVKDTEKKIFEMAMNLVFINHHGVGENRKDMRFRCNGYKVKDNMLILSTYSEECTPFPYDLNEQQTIEFAWGWYENNAPKGDSPDTDGSTSKAFEINTQTEEVGCGSNDWGCFVEIKPIWFVYGK